MLPKNILAKITLVIIAMIGHIHAHVPLFEKFPQLQEHIPYISLGSIPTPVVPMQHLEAELQHDGLFIKRDDLTGKKVSDTLQLYGGNKVRKLEFLLADALAHEAKTIVTFGNAGSNHALATATYAQELGLNAILMLRDQPNSAVVRHNLLLDQHYGTKLQWYATSEDLKNAADALLKEDPSIYKIPTGGSNNIGSIGFVNAAFELAEQIAAGQIAQPDFIYVPAGSCGTTAGLLLGLQAAQLDTQLVSVAVFPESKEGAFLALIKKLFLETNEKLHALDEHFPLFNFPEEQLILHTKFCGPAYGVMIPEAQAAINAIEHTEQIKLEGTYSAKALAALMDDVATGKLEGKNILFWNTYCGTDYSSLFSEDDYKKLPREFQKYFEEKH